MESESSLTLIAAIGRNNELGKEGGLIWHVPEDLRHFKELTTGSPVIMGRKTWESLPVKPLPGRLNIVVTTNENFKADGAERAESIDKAVALAGGHGAFIIGGESIYRQALPLADRLELTEIDLTDDSADTWFPKVETGDWKLTHTSERHISRTGVPYRFKTFIRIR